MIVTHLKLWVAVGGSETQPHYRDPQLHVGDNLFSYGRALRVLRETYDFWHAWLSRERLKSPESRKPSQWSYHLSTTDTCSCLTWSGVMMVFALVILGMLVTVSSASPCAGPVCSYTFDITSKSSHLWSGFNVGMLNSTLVTVPSQFQPFQPATPVPQAAVSSLVTLDGHQRDVIHINGQFPGPTIDVMKGVQVGY